MIKTIPKKKKWKKAEWLSEEALQIAVKRREAKGKGEKGRHTHLNAEFQRIAKRDKAFLSDQCKEIEENNRMGKTRDLFKKIRDTKETFHAKMGTIKDRNGISNFLEEIFSLSHFIVFLYFFALITEEDFFLSLLAILWNPAFKWVYLSFSPLLFPSLLFTAICKASSDSHFSFLHFFFLGMVLIPVSCIMS